MNIPHKNRKPHRINNDVEEKSCHVCMLWKPLDQYNKASTWDKLDRKCKDCCKKYREENKEKLNAKKKEYREAHKEQRKAWLEANKEQQREYKRNYAKQYQEKNKDKISTRRREYFQNNKEKIYAQIRERRKQNPHIRAASNLRSRISIALKGVSKSAHTQELLGCTIDYLRDWLEFQFDDKMTWENYGEWHVDHEIPCAVFNLEDPVEQRICFHYSNLRPLWGAENIAKSDKVEDIDVENIKSRLTSEVLTRLENKRSEEREKQKIKELENNEKLMDGFRAFWQIIEIPSQPPKIQLPRKGHEEQIRANISQNLSAYYQTPEGKENKKQSLAKRSQTMAAERNALRAAIEEKTCAKCKVLKSVLEFNKCSANKDGFQSYCRQCINSVKRAKKLIQQ